MSQFKPSHEGRSPKWMGAARSIASTHERAIEQIGIHVAKISKVFGTKHPNLQSAIKSDAKRLGLTCAQIFTHGPRRYGKNKLDISELKKIGTTIKLYVHASYPVGSSIWSEDGKYAKAKNSLADQLKTCALLGTPLVLHFPRKRLRGGDAPRIKAILNMAKAENVEILFENVPPLTSPYNSAIELKKFAKLYRASQNKWGFCIDTAHLWGGGIDISDAKIFNKWIGDLGSAKGQIKLIHFNGSAASYLGIGRDKHEIARSQADKIFNDDAFNAIMGFIRAANIPVICEINRGSSRDAINSINEIRSRMHI